MVAETHLPPLPVVPRVIENEGLRVHSWDTIPVFEGFFIVDATRDSLSCKRFNACSLGVVLGATHGVVGGSPCVPICGESSGITGKHCGRD